MEKSKTKLIKENRKLEKINDFVIEKVMYVIPREVLSDIACEAYDGKISAEQFLGACRYVDYMESWFEKIGKEWEKYVIKEQQVFHCYGRHIDAPTTWTKESRKANRERVEQEIIQEIRDRFPTND